MKLFNAFLIGGFIAALILTNPDSASAQNARNCAWPLLISQEGTGNTQGPETYAKYWLMPFDQYYRMMTIKGAYPNARYFSFVTYNSDNDNVPTAVADSLYDTKIVPDSGSNSYTVVVSRNPGGGGNKLKLSTKYGWVVLRIYIPKDYDRKSESGNALMGGVPLPEIRVTDQQGASQLLPTCWPVNKLADVSSYVKAFFTGFDITGNEGIPFSDRLWFAPPANVPPRLMPNPDNKYVLMFPGNYYQPGRIVVIHAKAPTVPDKNADMRFWTVCNSDLALPMFTVNCTSDQTTVVKDGYYTIVISDDLLRPDWLPPNVTWLPWGDEQYPKVMYLRNMLPSPSFRYSIQKAIDPCAFTWNFPEVPTRLTVDNSGRCTQKVMGDYYPVAVWCDKATFVQNGWRACIK